MIPLPLLPLLIMVPVFVVNFFLHYFRYKNINQICFLLAWYLSSANLDSNFFFFNFSTGFHGVYSVCMHTFLFCFSICVSPGLWGAVTSFWLHQLVQVKFSARFVAPMSTHLGGSHWLPSRSEFKTPCMVWHRTMLEIMLKWSPTLSRTKSHRSSPSSSTLLPPDSRGWCHPDIRRWAIDFNRKRTSTKKWILCKQGIHCLHPMVNLPPQKS